MKVVYIKNILDKIEDAVKDAIVYNKNIDYIELNESEWTSFLKLQGIISIGIPKARFSESSCIWEHEMLYDVKTSDSSICRVKIKYAHKRKP